MKRFCWPLAVLMTLGCALASFADPPSLTVPATVAGEPGDFITVPATTQGKNVTWIVLDKGLKLFPVALQKDTRTAVVCGRDVGTYRLLAITAAGDEISAPAICNVVIQTPEPPPAPPSPAPAPAPSPPPAAAKVTWAVAVIDNNTRTAAQGQLLGSATLIQSLRQRGVTLRVLDVNDPQIKGLNYGPAVTAAGGAPALLEFTDTGQRVKAIPLPGDEAGFLAAIPAPPTASRPSCPNCPNGLCPINPFLQVKP